MVGSHPVLRWLTVAIIGCGILVWLGLALYGFSMIFQGEGNYSSARQLLIVLMDLFLVLGCWAMVASLRVLLRPPSGRRLPLVVLLVVGAQLAVLLWALSLAHYVRSGEAWISSTWRQLLADMGLVDLFAYYPRLGAAAIGAALVVVTLMLLRILGLGRDAGPAAAGRSPARPSNKLADGSDEGVRGVVRIKGEIVINRPVEEVFDFVSDERNEPRYNPQMIRVEQVSGGPIGVGTQFRAEARSGGRSVPMLIEFTSFERPVRLGSHSSMSSMIIDGELTFEPCRDATLMRWSWDLQPAGVLRLLTPLVAWMGRRQEDAVWSGLKRLLEEAE